MPSPQGSQFRGVLLRWVTAVTALVATIATVALALGGRMEEAKVVGVVAAAALGAGGIQITVQIRR